MKACEVLAKVVYTTPIFTKLDVVPKYFAVDVDGTFMTGDEASQSKNNAALRDVLVKGIVLFFCTGRPLFATINKFGPDFVEKTGYNGYPGVYCNGAIVVDYDGSIISKKVFSRKFIEDFVGFIKKNDTVDCVMFVGIENDYSLVPDPIVIERESQIYGTIGKTIVVTPPQLYELDIVNIHVAGIGFLNSFQGYSPNIDYVSKEFRGISNISPAGITKAQGVLEFCKFKGLEPRGVGFIGDGSNDVELMKLSDLSFATGNAVEQAKQSAKYVLHETCDEAAFARAMTLVYNI